MPARTGINKSKLPALGVASTVTGSRVEYAYVNARNDSDKAKINKILLIWFSENKCIQPLKKYNIING